MNVLNSVNTVYNYPFKKYSFCWPKGAELDAKCRFYFSIQIVPITEETIVIPHLGKVENTRRG